MKSGKRAPVILGFFCNWCSYAGADLAGSMRSSYPANLRIVRVPCSGRVDPVLVLKALSMGADGVLVAGCHPGECHYRRGNLFARRRLVLLSEMLELFGYDRRRFRVEWISASEGERVACVAAEMAGDLAGMIGEDDGGRSVE